MITSKSNSVMKYVSNLKLKKYRDINNRYVVEGIKMVREVINSEKISPEFIIYSKEILQTTSLGKEFLEEYSYILDKKDSDKRVIEVSKEVFKYVADTESPQGILIVINKEVHCITDLEEKLKLSSYGDRYIILENIQDHGNVGTIIRSAVAFGVYNIICLDGTADIFSPKVVRSTMGCLQKVNIFHIKKENIAQVIKMLNKNSYQVIATTLGAKKFLHEYEASTKDVFVFGNEANGISKEIEIMCNSVVKIAMTNLAESLNVAVAASIAMANCYIKSKGKC